MSKTMLLLLVCVFTSAIAVPAFAQGERTIRGEIVGLKCYMNAASGREAAMDEQCTRQALSAGEPAGIIEEETGDFYIAVSADGTNAAELLLPISAVPVEVTGDVNERQGIRTIAVEEVRASAPAPETAAGQGAPANDSAR